MGWEWSSSRSTFRLCFGELVPWENVCGVEGVRSVLPEAGAGGWQHSLAHGDPDPSHLQVYLPPLLNGPSHPLIPTG